MNAPMHLVSRPFDSLAVKRMSPSQLSIVREEVRKALSELNYVFVFALDGEEGLSMIEITTRVNSSVKLAPAAMPETEGRAETVSPQAAELDRIMSMIEKSQQLAGHFPNEEALERARRVVKGEISADQAREELAAKYSAI